MKKIVLLLSFCLSFILGYSQYDLSKNIDRQVMVVPQKGMESQTQAFIQRSNAQIVANFEQLGWYVVLLPENLTQDSFVRSSKELPFIKEVYKDQKVEMKMDYIPNDVEFASCWHLKQSTDKDIDADEAWDLVPANNPTVSVAMFDGGLDLTIPDLVGNTTNPFNAVNSTTNIPYVNAEDKHGTACSGTIAAVTNNGIGVSSVGNNKVKVMPVNIMSQVFAGGSFSTSDVIQINAVNASMANPTCVAIAMSYGGSSYSSALDAAFNAARTTARGGKGMIVVASSGNGYSGTANQYPANYSGVWGIGATSSTDVRASFSNYGQICDISAPGVSIRTTDRLGADGYDPGDYRSVSGTSFSCPITAAAAAFIFYKNWELTDDQVLQILSQTAEKVG
jgi:subtilisin family serine protease